MDSIEVQLGFRATAGRTQGLGRTPQEALTSLLEHLPDYDLAPILILPYNQGDPFFTENQQERLQDLKSRREDLTAGERSELEQLVAAAFDATISRTHGLMQRPK